MLRKLPNVTPDEVQAILERMDEEAAGRASALPPALREGAAKAAAGGRPEGAE